MIKESMEKIQHNIETIMNSQDFKDNIKKSHIEATKSGKELFTIRLCTTHINDEVRFSIYFDMLDIETLLLRTNEEYWDFWPLICTINDCISNNPNTTFDRVERINNIKVLNIPSNEVYDKTYVTQGDYVTFYIKYEGA